MKSHTVGKAAATSLMALSIAAGGIVPAVVLGSPASALAATQDVAAAALPSVSSRTLSGTTVGQPFVPQQTAGSQHFRIPSLITLDNGWLLAGADARWGSYGDSPQNLDGLASISKDGGKTWEWELVNEFVDFPGGVSGAGSASFIDPTFIQGSDGTVYMVADAWPAGTGIWSEAGKRCESTGFDESGNFLLAKGRAGQAASLESAEYTHYCDASAARDFSIDGKPHSLRPIKDAAGTETGTWIDEYYDLYTVEDGKASPVIAKQHGTDRDIHANVFYHASEWKAYPTCYLWLVKGTVTNEGIDWGAPQVLDVKREDDQPFTGICPGRGLVVPLEGGGERIMFQVYESLQGGNEKASAIWSDDGGKTWERGERTTKLGQSGKSSESQTILLPDGSIRMYSRNGAGFISYADSTDGGKTWSEYKLDQDLAYVGNCMVSFINLEGGVVDAQGRAWGNLVAASYPRSSGRNDGVVRIGSINEKTNEVTWLNENEVRYEGRFLYSCLTQVEGGKLGIVYENQSEGNGGKDVIFETFTVADILGDGWSHINRVPELSLAHGPESMMSGRTQKLTASIGDIPGAKYSWSIDEEGEGVVSLSSTVEPDTTMTAKSAGKATIAVTATVEIDGRRLTLSDSFTIYVSEKGSAVLPDRYANALDASYQAPFKVAAGELQDGGYLVQRGGKLLYMHTGKVTDRIGGGVSNGVVNHSTEERFPLARQTWVFETTEKGTTIKSAATGDYLNITGPHDDGLPFSADPTYFTIAPGKDGSYLITTRVGDETFAVDQTAKGNFKSTKIDAGAEASLAGVTLGRGDERFTVSSSGIEALLADADALGDANGYTPQSRSSFMAAREAARAALSAHRASHDNRAAAETAKAKLDDACRDLHMSMLELEELVEPEPQPEPQPEPNPDPKPNPEDPQTGQTGGQDGVSRPNGNPDASLPQTGDAVGLGALASLAGIASLLKGSISHRRARG